MPEINRTISIRELKTHTSAVLREVQATGAEFVITVRGRPVARIEPMAGESVAVSVDGMGSSRGALSEMSKLQWDDFNTAKKLWEPNSLDDE